MLLLPQTVADDCWALADYRCFSFDFNYAQTSAQKIKQKYVTEMIYIILKMYIFVNLLI